MWADAAVVAAAPNLLAIGLDPGLLVSLAPGLGFELVGAGLLASRVAWSLDADALDASILLLAVFLVLVGDAVLPLGSVGLPELLLLGLGTGG